MTALLTALAALADDDKLTISVRVADLRSALQKGDGKAILTPREAASEFGWTPRQWQKWAPEVEGARQDGGSRGRWRLPREGCVRQVERVMQADARATASERRKPRGPWKKAAIAPAARFGAEDREAGAGVDGRSEAIRGQTIHFPARSERSGLAPSRPEGDLGGRSA